MKKLYDVLQSIAETFKDTVPVSYTSFPVIRYAEISENSSLSGDDQDLSFSSFFQVDLYDHSLNEEMKERLKEAFKENHWKIQSILFEEEGSKSRVIFEIKIEE